MYYTGKEIELPTLVENKVFKPVKNMIIRRVLNISLPDKEDDLQQTDEPTGAEERELKDEKQPGIPVPTEPAEDTTYNEYENQQEQLEKEQEALTGAVMSLFIDLCSVIRNDYAQGQRKMQPKADKKLTRMIRKKEIALGCKCGDMTINQHG